MSGAKDNSADETYLADADAARPQLLTLEQQRRIGTLSHRKTDLLGRRGTSRADRKKIVRLVRDIETEVWAIRNGWQT